MVGIIKTIDMEWLKFLKAVSYGNENSCIRMKAKLLDW